MSVFSYYWDGERQTRTDDAYLLELTKGLANQSEIIEGIKSSEREFTDKLSAN